MQQILHICIEREMKAHENRQAKDALLERLEMNTESNEDFRIACN